MSRDCVAVVTLTPVTPSNCRLHQTGASAWRIWSVVPRKHTHGDVCERQNAFVTHVKLFCERDELIPRFSKDPEDPSHVHKSGGTI